MSTFEVLYDFVPQNEGDLELTTGEIIIVTEKPDHGWWSGRTSDGHEGVFPMNYVREVKNAPVVPPRPPSATGPAKPPKPAKSAEEEESDAFDLALKGLQGGDGEDDGESDDEEAGGGGVGRSSDLHGHMLYAQSVAAGQPFSIESLDAFDELMNDGFCIERKGEANAGQDIEPGMRVDLQISAITWDGAATVVHTFKSGAINFAVGQGQVPLGLDEAVQRLHAGDEATVTCAPQMAYGEAGQPPFVPPNSHMVFHIAILMVEEGPADGIVAPARGPEELLFHGIKAKSNESENLRAAKVRSVVFQEGERKSSTGGLGISDEELARAAASMNVGGEGAGSGGV